MRTLLTHLHPHAEPHPHTHFGAYALCAGLALAIGQLIERARSRLTSRVCSAMLGTAATVLAAAHGEPPVLAPILATAALLAATCAGELAYRMLGTRRPTWHSMIFFVGAAGVTRTLLAAREPAPPEPAHYGAYALCVGFAVLIAALMRRTQSDLTPRVHSGTLGVTALLLAVFHGDLPPHAPVAATALIFGATCAGEVAYRLRVG